METGSDREVAGDKYIFFTTYNEGARGEFEENVYTLWRCSRETNECESLGKLSQSSLLVVYDDFLFGVERRGEIYGTGGRDA